METIHSLRKRGFKVRVIHYRYGQLGRLPKVTLKGITHDNSYPEKYFKSKENLSKQKPNPKGGKTHIDVTTPEGKNVSGEAVCSVEDTFNRKLGNNIALGRALKQLK